MAMGLLNQMQGLSREELAQKTADYCNENGINLDQLKGMLGL